MEFTEAERKEAKHFGEFYIDMMENYRNTVKYYLSEDVVLDWFGQTVKGEKNVSAFLKKTLASVKHIMSDTVPAKKIGFRETHVIKVPRYVVEKKNRASNPIGVFEDFSLMSFFLGNQKDPLGPDESPRITVMRSETKTPKKQSEPSTSSSALKDKDRGDTDKEYGQGNGCHNPPDLPVSPAKRFKPAGGDFMDDMETLECESEGCVPKIKNVTAEGAVEFHRPSMKKLQTETKWRRPCKLGIAYSSTNCNDCTIYLIIYEGNVKCRRNLMKDFEAEEPEN